MTTKEFEAFAKRIKKENEKHKKCEWYILTEDGLVCECEYKEDKTNG